LPRIPDAVADVVEKLGGVVSDLFNESDPLTVITSDDADQTFSTRCATAPDTADGPSELLNSMAVSR
jgi:hypothetical protein